MTLPASSSSTARRIRRGSGVFALISSSMEVPEALRLELEHSDAARRDFEVDRPGTRTEDRIVEKVHGSPGAGSIDARSDTFLRRVDGEEHARSSPFVAVQRDANSVGFAGDPRQREIFLGR